MWRPLCLLLPLDPDPAQRRIVFIFVFNGKTGVQRGSEGDSRMKKIFNLDGAKVFQSHGGLRNLKEEEKKKRNSGDPSGMFRNGRKGFRLTSTLPIRDEGWKVCGRAGAGQWEGQRLPLSRRGWIAFWFRGLLNLAIISKPVILPSDWNPSITRSDLGAAAWW